MPSTTASRSSKQRGNPSRKIIPIWGWVSVALIGLTLATHGFANGRTNCVTNGLIALAVFIGNALYVARKRFFLTRFGTLHSWMVGHIALGSVFFLAVYLHAGLTDIGSQGWILYGLTIAETLSGVWGLHELRATPRRFAQLEQKDFLFPSAIRRRIGVLRLAIEKIVERRPEEFEQWVNDQFGDVLDGSSNRVTECEDFPAKYQRHAHDVHDNVTEIVRLRGVQQHVDQLSRRSKLWLWFHIPVSVALVTMVTLHVLGWLYY